MTVYGLLIVLLLPAVVLADGDIVAWGQNDDGQCNVPAPNADFSSVSGGGCHSLGRKTNGSVVAWGRNDHGKCNVPAPNANFMAIAAARFHSIGLKDDGSIVAWGRNYDGQCNALAGTNFTAVAAGGHHSLSMAKAGACCHADGSCDVLLEDDCSAAGGTYQGDGTTCDPNPCPQPGDLDGDGDVDFDDTAILIDVLLGIDTDETHRARADLDGSGAPDGTDVQPFVDVMLMP